METPAGLQPLELSLTQSIQHYEDLRRSMQKMDNEIGTADPVALQDFSIDLNALQERAMDLDRTISVQLNASTLKNSTIQSLTEKRALLIKEILLLNQRITAKASGAKSLIAHEMGQLRTGLAALSGYRQPQHTTGRITNSTS